MRRKRAFTTEGPEVHRVERRVYPVTLCALRGFEVIPCSRSPSICCSRTSPIARSFYIRFAKITMLEPLPVIPTPAAEVQCLRYQALSSSTFGSPVWHPTCNREGRRQNDIAVLGIWNFRCALRQRMPAKRPPLASRSVSFRGRNQKSRNTPVTACWSGAPKRSPNLEELYYEPPHSRYFAAGRSACVSGLRADFAFIFSRSVSPAGRVADGTVHRDRYRQAASATAQPRRFLGPGEPICPQELCEAADRSHPRPRQ